MLTHEFLSDDWVMLAVIVFAVYWMPSTYEWAIKKSLWLYSLLATVVFKAAQVAGVFLYLFAYKRFEAGPHTPNVLTMIMLFVAIGFSTLGYSIQITKKNLEDGTYRFWSASSLVIATAAQAVAFIHVWAHEVHKNYEQCLYFKWATAMLGIYAFYLLIALGVVLYADYTKYGKKYFRVEPDSERVKMFDESRADISSRTRSRKSRNAFSMTEVLE